jgi:predicted metallopeptidase
MTDSPRQRAPGQAGFDFTHHMRLVCQRLVSGLDELRHIDLQRVAISCTRARNRGPYGLYASLTPLRFAGGARVERRRTGYYRTQTVLDAHGREMLYILSFCLPRFMDLDFRTKLATILHELWHIGPRFDGDIRRHAGRCYVHSASQQRYDAAMEQLADRYLRESWPSPCHVFLHSHFADLQRIFGRVHGVRVARPKLLRISADEARPYLAEDAARAHAIDSASDGVS